MKKIFLTLVLFFIGITALSKEAWSLTEQYYTWVFVKNSFEYMGSYSTSGCPTATKQVYVSGTSNLETYTCLDTNCTGINGSPFCAGCSVGNLYDSSGKETSTTGVGCCLPVNGGDFICNIQSTHACHPDNCTNGYLTFDGDGDGDCLCLTCTSNQYMNGTSCSNCSNLTGVQTCTSATVHTSCASKYYLNDSTCTSCPSNASCAGGTASFSCDSGYEKNSTGTGCSWIETVSSCPSYMKESNDGCCCNI